MPLSLSPSSPIPKSRLVEGSEFLNEEDASKAGLVPGVNGKPGPWSFEELIDLNVHSKSRPLLQSEDRNQGLIDCDGASDGPPRGGFEDNGAPGVKSMHSSPQPLEALAGKPQEGWGWECLSLVIVGMVFNSGTLSISPPCVEFARMWYVLPDKIKLCIFHNEVCVILFLFIHDDWI